MSKIHILSDQISNRIAAGEVIERPASVVKELVENAIDAGASRICIEVERAGSRLIRVTDDGCGMDGDDALMCIEPHGTSKIREEDDIDRISTLGFRGEAIPSIGSVAKLEIVTRRACDKEGVCVRVEGGRLLGADPAGCMAGTTFTVRDLFFNTPARKKFLKSPATESNHIEEAVIAMAIPNWKITFELVMDNRKVFVSPGAEAPESRLRDFFGRSFLENLWALDYHEGNLHLSGFTGSPGFLRPSRREQRTFVNGRAIESQVLYRAVREGYGTLAEPGKYPPCILFLDMPAGEVDVNVHPAKREVRFKQEFVIGRAVGNALAQTLRRTREVMPPSVGPAPALPMTSDGRIPLKFIMEGAEVAYHPSRAEEVPLFPGERPYQSEASRADPPMLVDCDPPEKKVEEVSAPAPAPEPVPTQEETVPFTVEEIWEGIPDCRSFNGDWPVRVLGIYDETYLLCEGKNALVLVDQHAAHERVMFEKLLKHLSERSVPRQNLLIPETIELPIAKVGLLLRNSKTFSALGFDVEPMGHNTVMLNAVPADLDGRRSVGTILEDMLAELVENEGMKIPPELHYVARAACRAAVKAHDKLSTAEAEELLRLLKNCRQGTLCPHGRPTMIALTKNELEKRFSRR